MNQVFLHVTAWLAPILAFTCEEAWQAYAHKDVVSVHLRTFPERNMEWQNNGIIEKFQNAIPYRMAVTKKLEETRETKVIGSSLQTSITIKTREAKKLLSLISNEEMSELCIVSSLAIVEEDIQTEIVISKLEDEIKCERCWRYLPEVGQDKAHLTLCKRCAAVVDEQQKLAA